MSTESKPVIQIKGIRDGLLVTVGEGEWPHVQDLLLQQIAEKGAFFKGARLALEMGNRVMHAADMSTLRDRLSEQGVALWAVVGNSRVTEETAQTLGLATRLAVPRPERTVRSMDTTLEGESAVLVQRTLRSGFKIATHGHVVVVGDVNPGAEVIAGGSVVVWGRLRGTVHAGAEGDTNAVVCSLEMNPMQLRIAGKTINPTPARGKPQPEIARIENGTVITEAWHYKDR